jgi:hypothetical protein
MPVWIARTRFFHTFEFYLFFKIPVWESVPAPQRKERVHGSGLANASMLELGSGGLKTGG